MNWTELPFGKHRGKTLPEIAFHDPDWLFWLLEKGEFYGQLAVEGREIEDRATAIILRSALKGGYAFDWVFDDKGRFCDLCVVRGPAAKAEAPDRLLRTSVLDLSLLHRGKRYDKGGNARLVKKIRLILFDDPDIYLTRARCDGFFNDPKNFG